MIENNSSFFFSPEMAYFIVTGGSIMEFAVPVFSIFGLLWYLNAYGHHGWR